MRTRIQIVGLLLMAAILSMLLAGCSPGPNVWHGVKQPAPVPAQPKEAGR